MQRNRNLAGRTLLLAALLMSFFLGGSTQAQAQHPAFTGKFTLPYPVRWGGNALQPGDYTLIIKSTGSPVIALVRTANGDAVTYVVSGSISGKTDGQNALLIRESRGQFVVHSLALAELGIVLVYDPSLSGQQVKEAQVKHSIPVMTAKK